MALRKPHPWASARPIRWCTESDRIFREIEEREKREKQAKEEESAWKEESKNNSKLRKAAKALGDLQRCDFFPKTNLIYVEGKEYAGCTNLLKQSFYGNYKFPVRPGRTLSGKKRVRRISRSQADVLDRYSSSRRDGDRFHRCVRHFYMCQGGEFSRPFHEERCEECKQFLGAHAYDVSNQSSQFKMVKGLDETLRSHKLTVVYCEAPVAWRLVGAGTLVDIVCMDREHRLVVIEVKSGYNPRIRDWASTTAKRGNRMLGEAGKHIQNTPMNQHMLQLWFGMNALRDTHDRYEIHDDGYLIYVDNHGDTETYHLSEWKLPKRVTLSSLEDQLRKE